MKKLFSRDTFAGVTRYWHYDEMTEQATIQTVMDETPLLEDNLKLRNERDKRTPYGEFCHVGRIPMHVYGEMLRTGKAHDEAYIKRWLNDPANLQHRTRHGKV